ncbi:uncharacterized protein LOC131899063 isoform X1 [Peromyscus eremicus]|uniref:uncharacterized protein LOC131899063 isoform X1 n=1 Tax=Peromyscus eremicus TaxID=42410 RepID=UPI0027DC972E|nr:uncharacterized protein LOC131899063 isoform X1 [Peromyscus eremicus]
MADCTFMLIQFLFICWFLMVHCTQPNCTSVRDFDDCLGNTTDFCPKDIVCACKDGKPFCKCQNFRGQLGDYWYMGDKCEQLWNTVDLILVATLPGIALALIVGVAIQIIHYCKGKSKKKGDHHREERNMPELRPHHNSTYGFDTDRNLPQPNQGEVNTETHLSNKNPWSLSHQEAFSGNSFLPSPNLSRINSNYMAQELKESTFYNYPARNWDDSPGPTKPAINYGNNLSTTNMKPIFDFSISGPPRPAYSSKEKKYSAYEEQQMPYKIGWAHMKSNY